MLKQARRHEGTKARSERTRRGNSRSIHLFSLRAYVPTCLRAFVVAFVAAFPSSLHAAPSQDDVFKKIQQSVGEKEEVDLGPVLWLAGGGGAVALLLYLLSHKKQKVAGAKSLNHGGKLLREVMKEVPLSAAELKQLKLLADSVQQQTGEPATPLTLLLCPSLLAKGLQAKPAKLDRAAVAQVVRKMQLGQQDPRVTRSK